MYGFLRAPKWIAAHLVVAILAAAFVGLGLWQLDRLGARRAFNQHLTARASQPVEDVRALFANEAAGAVAYRRVEARGIWDTGNEVILRARSRKGIAGNHVLTPLRTAGGTALIVDRGWVELATDEPPVTEAAPPGGEVLVRGVLFPSQVRGRFGPKDATGRLEGTFRIDVPRLAEQVPYPLYPMFLHLESQEPAQPGPYPKAVGLPELDEGPHLSYALQWFAFALVGVIGYGAMIRARVRARAPEQVA